MIISIYKFFNKKHNSTKQPISDNLWKNVNVKLKEETSIYEPTFLITGNEEIISYCSYVSWSTRYYFVEDIIKTNIQNVWEIRCKLDILATFKTVIQNSTCYVSYSNNLYNSKIPDDRLNFTGIQLIAKFTTEFKSYNNDFNTIIQYISANDNTFAPTSYRVLSNSALKSLGEYLMSDSLSNNLEKQLDSVASAIVGCMKFPFRPSYNSEAKIITIGNTQLSVAGFELSPYRESGSITINYDFFYDDFRNYEPYTKWLLFLPAYGYLEVPSDIMVYFNGKLPIDYIIDYITGSITWSIIALGKFDGSCAYNIPVAYSGINAINTITNIASAGTSVASGIASAFMGNAIGVGTGIAGAVNSGINAYVSGNTKVIGTQGSSSGSASSIYGGLYGETSWSPKLYRVAMQTVSSPQQLGELLGRPYKQVTPLINCSGYLQTVGASIATDYPDSITNELNNMLDGGIYIE